MDEEGKDLGVRPPASPDVQRARPLTISIEGKDAEVIIEEMITAGVVDITGGFPARNKQQLWDIIFGLARRNITRIPIIGIEEVVGEASSIRVYMLSDPREKIQHMALWNKLGKPANVSFTTSIEGFDLSRPAGLTAFLVLPDVTISGYQESQETAHLPLGTGSDVGAFYDEKHPLSKQFTKEGRGIIRDVFNIEGVEVYGV